MKKINTNELEEISWGSPKGTYDSAGKQVSEALGRKPRSTDLMERHPFDVEIYRLPPGKKNYPYHSHSAQWEFYHVIAGTGIMRDEEGEHRIEQGDAFIYKPGEAHQMINDSEQDLVVYVIADNPFGDHCYYPDSNKWAVQVPERRILRSDALGYYDGEE